jgi:hypothetical protein
MESIPKPMIMMTVVVVMVMMIMGHECKKGTLWERGWG